MNSKSFEVVSEWDDNYEKEGYASTDEELISMILNDKDLDSLDEIIVNYWEEPYEKNSQEIINMFVENKIKFKNLKSLFIGNMDYEVCEISWILQGDYSEIWNALPNLEKLKIKGGSELTLGEINHQNLKELEIITGGLGSDVIKQIKEANLPSLEKLVLYIGTDEYGFDGGIQDINNLLVKLNSLKNLKYLGIVNSDIQNQLVKVVMDSEVVSKLEVLDLSYGTLIDIGAKYIIDNIDKLKNIKKIELNRSYFTKEMYEKLKSLHIEVGLEEVEEIELNDKKINEYYLNSNYDWEKEFYKKTLEELKMDKIEFEKMTLENINQSIMNTIISDVGDVYPLYTE